MRVVIAGGSGFLGQRLTAALVADGHRVTILTRGSSDRASPSSAVRFAPWTPDGSAPTFPSGSAEHWTREIAAADAIVNLAGEGIADRRWSTARKESLRRSRTESTRSLVAAIRASEPRPRVFVGASAIGYYGDGGDAVLDESSPAGSDFLAKLCVDWEAEASAAPGCRVVLMRTGIVLSRDGGALKKLVPPFLLFGGGPIASGRQWMSWIHVDDYVAMMRWAIETAAVSGPLNGTAPNPARNAEFSRALGRALHRPSWLPMPGFALALIVGEMAGVALVAGQRVLPAKATALGFTFQYPGLDDALRAALRRA